jgi:hypothetical protein
MTYSFSSIGRPEAVPVGEPDSARRIGNLPDRERPAKWRSLDIGTSQLWQLAESSAYECRRIDWGA